MKDNSLETKGYNLVRVAHPNDVNTGEIYIIESHFLLGLLVNCI